MYNHLTELKDEKVRTQTDFFLSLKGLGQGCCVMTEYFYKIFLNFYANYLKDFDIIS